MLPHNTQAHLKAAVICAQHQNSPCIDDCIMAISCMHRELRHSCGSANEYERSFFPDLGNASVLPGACVVRRLPKLAED